MLAGIDAAAAAGFAALKIDTVVMRGRQRRRAGRRCSSSAERVGAEVRFIEYMDVGGATRWSPDAVVSRREMLEAARAHVRRDRAAGGARSAPAERFRLADGTTFGIIASTTEPFCGACDRSRLTADGLWLLCLYARGGTRSAAAAARRARRREELRPLISTRLVMRADRGAEERLASTARDVLIPVAALKRDAHLEMHTRGG